MPLSYVVYLLFLAITVGYFYAIDTKFKGKIHIIYLVPLLIMDIAIVAIGGMFPYDAVWYGVLTVILMIMQPNLGGGDKFVLAMGAVALPSILIWSVVAFASILFMLDSMRIKKGLPAKLGKLAFDNKHYLYADYLAVGLAATVILALVFLTITSASGSLITNSTVIGYQPMCAPTIGCLNATQLTSLGYNVSSMRIENGVYYMPIYAGQNNTNMNLTIGNSSG